MKNAKLFLVVALVLASTSCKRHKHVVDAGVVEEPPPVVDAGEAPKPAAVDAGTAKAAEVTGTVIVVSGSAERDAAGTWKIGLQLAPGAPGALPASEGAPAQLNVVITRATGSLVIPLRTSFEMQGITAFGPLDVSTTGAIVAAPVQVPDDATKLAIVADGKELVALKRKPTPLKIESLVAKAKGPALDVDFKFDPKSPVSWVLFAKNESDWRQLVAGDDQKTSAAIPGASLPEGDDVALRLDATDGFTVATQELKAAKPKAGDAVDAGALVDDAGP